MFDAWLAWYRAAARALIARGSGQPVAPDALDEVREAAVGGAQGPLAALVERLGLDGEAVDFLWCVVGASVEPIGLAERRRLVPDAERGLDLASYAALTGADPVTAARFALAFSADHPLIRSGVLDLDPGSVPAAHRYRAPLATVARLAGRPGVGALPEVVAPRYSPEQELARRRLIAALAPGEPVLVLVEGPRAVGKRAAVAGVARSLGRSTAAAELDRLDVGPTALLDALRAVSREHAFAEVVPVVANLDELPANDPRWRVVTRWLEELPATVVATSSARGLALPVTRRVIRIDWPLPDVASRRTMWGEESAVALSDDDLDELAFRYQLGAGGIRRAAASAGMIAQGVDAPAVAFPHVVEAIRGETAERLQSLATRVEHAATWDDLVTSDETAAQLRSFVGRVRHSLHVYERWGFRRKVGKATGASALFSGPPGTGKTMVAGLMARELGLALYQVDLSRVISKWVGETEKQLGALFDAAAGGHVMLLFDEADALFTKRSTDVKSATDRYANLEVNYLLQRIEAFGGVTILTTNLDTNLDEALRRRLSTHVVFWPPDETERAALWRKFLDGVPQAGDIDIDELVDRYAELSGGHIKNAVLAAAFVAASAGTSIDHRMLDRAGRAEEASLGKVLGGGASGGL